MSNIAINFFALSRSNFCFILHCSPYAEANRPEVADFPAVRRKVSGGKEQREYWTTMQPHPNSKAIRCSANDQVHAALQALRYAIWEKARNTVGQSEVRLSGSIRPRIEITMTKFKEGVQCATLQPYYLKKTSQFGILADFRFHPTEEHRKTIRALQLSLSLDKNGQPNRNHYVDRYEQISKLIRRYFPMIFPITLDSNQEIHIESEPMTIEHELLDRKHYIFANRKESKSQFMGVKNFGPINPTVDNLHLYFIYKREHHSLSRDLFRALRGDTFRTFEGMSRIFNAPLSNANVHGIAIDNFTPREIERIRDKIINNAQAAELIPVVLTPFNRFDLPLKNRMYWHLKHAFLSKGIPIQVVASDTVADRNVLKWSTASIGLQIFAKSGGKPWKVRAKTERCLIVGVGQSHRQSQAGIDRYFAYSILVDSSGVFKEVRVLAETRDENRYIDEFSESLRKIILDYSGAFSSFVIHSTFTIRMNELQAIADVLESQSSDPNRSGTFVSMKFNDRNGFFGYAMKHNSLVPFESTVLEVSDDEFLVWFEGLQYNSSTVRKHVGGPVHVKFTYTSRPLNRDHKLTYLQDSLNLSGANWRGFNAKNLPVSVYYANLIARYLKEFDRNGLPTVDVNIIKPWFL